MILILQIAAGILLAAIILKAVPHIKLKWLHTLWVVLLAYAVLVLIVRAFNH